MAQHMCSVREKPYWSSVTSVVVEPYRYVLGGSLRRRIDDIKDSKQTQEQETKLITHHYTLWIR
jgi:hypothetical protein